MRSSNPNLQPSNASGLLYWVKPAIIGGLAVAALTGCTPGSAPNPEQTVSASPSPEETETAPAVDRWEGTDFERTDPLPAELAEAESATPEEFAQLPKSVQIKWATWAGQYKDEFVAYFGSLGIDENDKPYTITADSNVKELIIDRTYQQRVAANFGLGSPTTIETNGPVDRIKVKKYITAFTVVSDEASVKIDNFVKTIGDVNGQAINLGQQFALDLYNTSREISESQDFSSTTNVMVVDDKSIPCFRVNWTAVDGSSTSNFNIGAYSTVDYKNQPIVVAVISF